MSMVGGLLLVGTGLFGPVLLCARHRELAEVLGESLGGGQRVAVELWKGLGAVLGDLDRRSAVAQGVFGNGLVGALAEDESDGGVVVRVGDEVIDGGEVEAELAYVLGLERADLQLDGDVAAQLELVEEEILRRCWRPTSAKPSPSSKRNRSICATRPRSISASAARSSRPSHSNR